MLREVKILKDHSIDYDALQGRLLDVYEGKIELMNVIRSADENRRR